MYFSGFRECAFPRTLLHEFSLINDPLTSFDCFVRWRQSNEMRLEFGKRMLLILFFFQGCVTMSLMHLNIQSNWYEVESFYLFDDQSIGLVAAADFHFE